MKLSTILYIITVYLTIGHAVNGNMEPIRSVLAPAGKRYKDDLIKAVRVSCANLIAKY